MTNFTDINKAKRERAVAAAQAFTAAVNEMGFDAETFAKEIRREHRTLQQNVGRVVLELLSQWGGDGQSQNYDLRNAGICKAAADMEPYNPGGRGLPHV
jgi:hypothetical protein